MRKTLVRVGDENSNLQIKLEARWDMIQVLKINEVAEYLRVSPSTIYRLLKSGELPAFKMGSDWRFNLEAIDQWRSRKETSNN